MAKLMSHPKTSKYFADPQFKNLIEFCKQQPQMFLQLIQSDPRMMDVFAVVSGIDLDKFGEERMQQKKEEEGEEEQ